MKFIISEHIYIYWIYTSETVLYVHIGLYSAIPRTRPFLYTGKASI